MSRCMRFRSRLHTWAAAILAGAILLSFAGAKAAAGQGSAPPAPDGYSYYWPGACVQAMQRSENFYWRAREDTAQYTTAGDTLLDDVRRVARDCAARFKSSGPSLSGNNLIPLAQVLLAAGDDAGAKQAVERRLAEADVKSTAARAWTLAQIVKLYLNEEWTSKGYRSFRTLPVRVDVARGYLAQLDLLRGADAAPGQTRAWLSLTQYYRHIGDDARMRAAIDSTIKTGKDLNEHDRSEYVFSLLSAYQYLADAEGDRTGEAAAPRAVLARASADLGKLPRIAPAIARYDTLYSRYGTKGPAVFADLWIAAAADTVHPRPGKVSILNFNPERSTIPATRRLARAIGDTVDVALVHATVGYFRDLGPLTFATEVPEVRKYFVDELNIAGSLAIIETHYHTIADGRRVADPNANDRAYPMGQRGQRTSIVVLDRQGIIRRIWLYWDNVFEPAIVTTLNRYK